jgi:hypothetical protein
MRLILLIVLLTAIGVCYKNTQFNRHYGFIARRQTIEVVENHPGIVKNIGSAEIPVYVIFSEKYGLNFFPYNLPRPFQQPNIPVVFGGNMKEMHPLEDEYGQYFELVNVEKR